MATISGKWYFKEYPSLQNPPESSKPCEASVRFTSNGNTYSRIRISSYSEYSDYAGRISIIYDTTVYNGGEQTWSDDAYREVDFGDTEQEVSSTFYNYLCTLAKQATSILMGGTRIAAIFDNQDAKLRCEGLVMSDDLIVSVGYVGDKFVEIRYESASLPFVYGLDDNQVATLKCKNKIMSKNLIVSAGVDKRVITFVILNTTHSAIQGMTWRELVNDPYYAPSGWKINSDGYVLNASGIKLNGRDQYWQWYYIDADEVIDPENEYTWNG